MSLCIYGLTSQWHYSNWKKTNNKTPGIALSQVHTVSVWLADHEGPSSRPHLITQHPCLWSQTPACLYPHPAHTPHGFLIHSVTCQSAPSPPSTPRPHELLSAPSLSVSKGFAGALWVLCSYPTHPAQQRHMVNTSSSLTADLVSQKDWYSVLLSPQRLGRENSSKTEVGPHFGTFL